MLRPGVVTSRDPRLELLKGNMITDVNQMISTLGLPTSISPEEGVLPSSVVGIDPDFKMPASKTSLAGLPAACIFPASSYTEGMFSKVCQCCTPIQLQGSDKDTWSRFNKQDNSSHSRKTP